MFQKLWRWLIWMILVILMVLALVFSKWQAWLINKTVFLVPMLFGFAWWFIEVGHLLFNKPQNDTYSDANWETEWKWLSERKWVISRLLNDFPLMDIEPLWGTVNNSPTFDMMGRLQALFTVIAVLVLLGIVIVSKIMGLPPLLGDVVKMIGGAAGLKEIARWVYRGACSGLYIWYVLANVFGRKVTIQQQSLNRKLTDIEEYFTNIHRITGNPPNYINVYNKDPHSTLWSLYQNLALKENGTFWFVLLVLSLTSVTTLINGFMRPKPVPPAEQQCCAQKDKGMEDGEDDYLTEGIYMKAFKANTKWTLHTAKDFFKQIFFPLSYVLIGIIAYGLPALLLVYCSKDWQELTGQTLKSVTNNLINAGLFVSSTVGLAMLVMNILLYMNQLDTLQEYVVGHILTVIISFTLIGWLWF
jgi:hypothetical protein